jgi:hypothetical protein
MPKAKIHLQRAINFQEKFKNECDILSSMLEEHLGDDYFVMHQTGDGMVIVTPTEGNIPLYQVNLDKLFSLPQLDAINYIKSFTDI